MARSRRAAPVELASNPQAWPDPQQVSFAQVTDAGLRSAAQAAAGFAHAVVTHLLTQGWRTQSGAPSASELSRRCGVDASVIGRVLRGQVWPDFETVARLADACDLAMPGEVARP